VNAPLDPATRRLALDGDSIGVPLPPGESSLWRGSPRAVSVARHIFHIGAVGAYFALLFVWHVGSAWFEGGFGAALRPAGVDAALAAVALGLIGVISWAVARSTVYLVTTRRVVMQIGVALPMALNIPFRVIQSVDIARHRDGTGDIAMRLVPGDHFAYLHLWPHARPWWLAHPQPMLRCIPDAPAVAGLIADAMRAACPPAAPRIVTRPTRVAEAAE
jgi:hypothetical protein